MLIRGLASIPMILLIIHFTCGLPVIPDFFTILGTLIIVLSGVYVLKREEACKGGTSGT